MTSPAPIAYVLGTFPSLSETFILRELLALEARGIPLVVFALRAYKTESPDISMLKTSVIHGEGSCWLRGLWAAVVWMIKRPARVGRVVGWSMAWAWRDGRVWRSILCRLPVAFAFAREAERIGVRHVHAHFAHIPSDMGIIMAELLGCDYSLSVHAWDIYAQRAAVLRPRLEKAAFVSVCTEQALQFLHETFSDLSASTFHLIRHGVPAMPIRTQPPSSPPLLLAVGRLVAKKGVDDLIVACATLKERGRAFGCCIIGEGPERHRLEAVVRQWGLQEEIDFKGALTFDAVVEFYQKAAMFIHSSRVMENGDRDGLPNVLLEAMAMGLPVIASTASAAAEVIEDGSDGYLVEPANPEMLADRIERLLDDADLCAKMGTRGKEKVRREFDMNRNIEPLLQMLEGDRNRHHDPSRTVQNPDG